MGALRWSDSGPIRILDFDIETRRIGFHNAGRFAPDGCEPVAIAAGWVDGKQIRRWLLSDFEPEEMLLGFRELYEQAGMVTGHYVRKFDLPILNGSLLERGLPLLGPKLVCDTKCDLVDRAGHSASQENLSLMLRMEENKFHMADVDWRAVARLEPEAMEACKRRVVDDVRQHKALRTRLLAAGALRPPRVWRP